MRFLVAALLATIAVASASPSSHHHRLSKRLNTNVNAAPSEKELEALFTSFVKTHNKKYTHDEFFGRFTTFKQNVEKIRVHNLGNASFSMAINEYADLTWEEFKATRLGYKHVDNSLLRSKNTELLDASNVASSVDWRQKGAVTAVKNQGQCGSCWSFSATGSMEGAVALATGKLVSLSEQELVDCSTAQGNNGCNGGLMDYAFQYVISNQGITSEASYPYTATGPNTCNSKGLEKVATIKSFSDVPAGDENALLAAVEQRPVSVAIEADQEVFQFYAGGVLDAACGTNLDHGVLVVGYGTDAGKDYWIVKNSWGESWGEQGYIRLVRGKNECGIANAASYPVA